RLGVDRSIATVYEMCLRESRWEHLQTAVIGVTDGDTVYHPDVLSENLRIFESSPTVDGVMPFLLYKFTAALRLFRNYRPTDIAALARHGSSRDARLVTVDLSALTAHHPIPRWTRHRQGQVLEFSVEIGRASCREGGWLTV